ncbi:SMC-Scp complex subunit ScpB [Patescibacteria group bacterium]|nr:SMC-Scp complex subunit ScpB [Patescibacteria group bacterium]
MNDRELITRLEALLFALGPLSREELAKSLDVPLPECERVLATLIMESRTRGVVVVYDGSMAEMRASPQAAEHIERVRKEAFTREIGRAGQETLAAVLYRGPLTRSEIDFIRGVNSSHILRTLTMRGLVRKVANPKDTRSFLYEPTTETYAHLGVQGRGDLPGYTTVRQQLAALEETYRSEQDSTNSS